MLSLCARDICPAEDSPHPDSPGEPESQAEGIPASIDSLAAPDSAAIRGYVPGDNDYSDADQQQGQSGHKPFYRSWKLWAAVGSALVAAIIIAVVSGGESGKDLPDFPDPPDR
jgi:hypothetical protein